MLDFRINFRKKYKDLKCPLGCDTLDTQQHCLHCDKILTSTIETQDTVKYEDLFSKKIEKQLRIGAVLQERIKYRKAKEKENKKNS